MALLKRGDILAADDLKTQDVEVPEWGGSVRIRTLTAAQRDDFDASLSSGIGTNRTVDLHNLRARLVSLCVVDEEGAPQFTKDDVAALGAKSAAALSRVFEAAQALNGMTPQAVEAAAKN